MLQRRGTSRPRAIYIPTLARPLLLVPPRIGMPRRGTILDRLLDEVLHAGRLGLISYCAHDRVVDHGHRTIGRVILAAPSCVAG